MMYSLQSADTIGYPQNNGTVYSPTLVDNYPTHSLLAPYDLNSYLNVYVKSHYPLQGITLKERTACICSGTSITRRM